MEKTLAQRLLEVIEIGKELKNELLVREAVIEFGKQHNLVLAVTPFENVQTYTLTTSLKGGMAIAWIKEFRELTGTDLQTAKKEYDRRKLTR